MRKTNIVTILVIAVLTIIVYMQPSRSYASIHSSFSDVNKNYWAAKQILTLANYDIISGGTDGRFRPTEGLRRSELAKLMVKSFVMTQNSNALGYTDLDVDHWASNFISTCVAQNIMKGFPDNTFRPDAMATRAQLAKTLVLLRGYPLINPEYKTFGDIPGNYWAGQYIETAAKNSLVSGYPDGTFRPDAHVTRAEAAALIYRALKGNDYLISASAQNDITYERYRRFIDPGAVNINIIKVPKTAPVSALLALSQDIIIGREKLSSIAKRKGAIAGINGDFFSLKTGECTGLMVDGQIISSPVSKRSYLGILPDKSFFIDRASMYATVTTSTVESTTTISAINKSRDTSVNTIVAYTPIYGPSTLTNNNGTEVIVKLESVVSPNSEVTGTVIDVRQNLGNSLIPTDGMVLSGIGSGKPYLAGLNMGDTVRLKFNLGPNWRDGVSAIGGGPRIMRNGKVYVENEGFEYNIVSARHPRTGIGIDSQGNLIVEVVDGRIENFSIGMSLTELANDLKNRGAVDAMNFDGGGSSTIYFNGVVCNYPNNGGSERAISNALLFLPQ